MKFLPASSAGRSGVSRMAQRSRRFEEVVSTARMAWSSTNDCITMSAPLTRVDCGCSTTTGSGGYSEGEAEKFYRDLKQQASSVRVGMEATEYSR